MTGVQTCALPISELGFDKGQQYVAVLYYNGAGTERNFKAALEWAKKAADGGLVQAMNTVGYLYEYGDYIEDAAEDKSKAAFNCYMKAAQNGNAAGQCNVGRCFAEGLGVARDKQEAVTWYTRAAEQGLDEAQFCLGECYDDGEGVDKNPVEAFYWYKEAAKRGHAKAACYVGYCYE